MWNANTAARCVCHLRFDDHRAPPPKDGGLNLTSPKNETATNVHDKQPIERHHLTFNKGGFLLMGSRDTELEDRNADE